MSALAGALASVGVPRDSIVRYEAAIKADQFVVIVHRANEREAEIGERVLRASAQSVDRT
jgi:predicted ribosome-associated RNA-binding protein Tma20